MLYQNKYVRKKYRVVPHLTSEGDFPRAKDGSIDESYGDYYIPCRSGKGEIYTTEEFSGKNEIFVVHVKTGSTANSIRKLKKVIIKEFDFGYEYDFYFLDKDIDKIAEIVKPLISGAKSLPSDNVIKKNPDKFEEYMLKGAE